MNKRLLGRDNTPAMLAEDARALMLATAHVAGKQVSNARHRLASTLDEGKNILDRVQKKAVECAKATDGAVHEHPYPTIGIALGVGALIGCLVARQWSRNRD